MEKDKLLKTIKILLKKYIDKNNEIKLEPKFIEEILFTENNDGTKSINNDIFYILRENKVDMSDVSFKNVHVKKHNFKGFKNIEINIDEIPNKDLSETVLEGIKLIGTLENANIIQTNFCGYIGTLTLNPQLIRNKNLYGTKLNGIIIDGIFDDVCISNTDFRGTKGSILINPQKVFKKELFMTNLERVNLIGNYNNQTKSYDKPCFDDCYLVGTNFNGTVGQIEINPQKVLYGTIAMCKGTGITFTDNFDGIITEGCDFKDCVFVEKNKKTDISKSLSLTKPYRKVS